MKLGYFISGLAFIIFAFAFLHVDQELIGVWLAVCAGGLLQEGRKPW